MIGIGIAAWVVGMLWIFPVGLDAPDELQDRAGRLRADVAQRPDVRALQRRQPLDDRDAVAVRSVHELARGRASSRR